MQALSALHIINCAIKNLDHPQIFSERNVVRSLYAIGRPSIVCLSVCLSSVCDVGAHYSAG